MISTEQTAPPVTMLMLQYRTNRRFIERDIRYLEKQFAAVDKLADPEKWLELQGQLGQAYQALTGLQQINSSGGFIVKSKI